MINKTNQVFIDFYNMDGDLVQTNIPLQLCEGKLPCIKVGDIEVFITSSDFPQDVWSYGQLLGRLNIVKGRDELDDILQSFTVETSDIPRLISFSVETA